MCVTDEYFDLSMDLSMASIASVARPHFSTASDNIVFNFETNSSFRRLWKCETVNAASSLFYILFLFFFSGVSGENLA